MCESHAFGGALVFGASVPDENGAVDCAYTALLRSPPATVNVQPVATLRKTRRFWIIARIHPPDACSYAGLALLRSSDVNPAFSGAFTLGSFEGSFDPGAIGRTCLDGGHCLRFALLFRVGGRVDHLGVGKRNANQPVIVANDQIPWLDHHAVNGDYPVHFAGTILVGTAMRNARCEDRKIVLADPAVITNGPIDDHACHSDLLRMGEHELAQDRVGQVAAGIDDQNVARFSPVESGMNHEVVAGALFDGQSWTGEDTARVERPETRPSMGHSGHRVANVRDSNVAVLSDGFFIDFAISLVYSEADSQVVLLSRILNGIVSSRPFSSRWRRGPPCNWRARRL